MAITLEIVEGYLKSNDIKFQEISKGDDQVILVTGWSVDHPDIGDFSIKVAIILEEKVNGAYEFVHFRAIKIADELEGDLKNKGYIGDDLKTMLSNKKKPDGTSYLDALFEYMLHQNYEKKIGSWAFDPSDSDIYVSAVVPIEDGELTEKQFIRLLGTITKIAKEGYAIIRRIAFNGDPKKSLRIKPSIDADAMIDLAVKLAMGGQQHLTKKLSTYVGDAEELKKSINSGKWDDVNRLLNADVVPDAI